MPSGDNGRSLTGAAPQARHGVPLQQHNLQGVALHRTRRIDGVKVAGSPLLGAVLALHTATLPSAAAAARSRYRTSATVSRRAGARAARSGDGAARDAAPASWRRWSPLRVSRAALRSRRSAYGGERRRNGYGGVCAEARHARRRGGGPGCDMEAWHAAGRSMTWTVERSFVRIS